MAKGTCLANTTTRGVYCLTAVGFNGILNTDSILVGDKLAQVLKDEIKQRIYAAAVDQFYLKDFQTATIRDIALKAGVAAGLVYSYYKDKHTLFETIVAPVFNMVETTLKNEKNMRGHLFTQFYLEELELILNLFDKHRQVIILIDKSNGTKFQNAREILVSLMELHIKNELSGRIKQEPDGLLFHILANNITEGILEIFRHYKSREWAGRMLDLVARQYYYGVDSLLK
jgi:AcrR family transcriptional regulator